MPVDQADLILALFRRPRAVPGILLPLAQVLWLWAVLFRVLELLVLLVWLWRLLCHAVALELSLLRLAGVPKRVFYLCLLALAGPLLPLGGPPQPLVVVRVAEPDGASLFFELEVELALLE